MSLFDVPTRRLLIFLVMVFVMASGTSRAEPALSPGAKHASPDAQIAALRPEIKRLSGLLPDQSSAMADVGYHFANLWFAAEKKNWPLAKFYFAETRSHLKWAVRIKPVRKTAAGPLVDLQGILDALDKTEGGMFSAIEKAIERKDSAAFATAYRQSLEGCYACHKASEKPCLRPQIPAAPPQPIINFDPDAKWPE